VAWAITAAVCCFSQEGEYAIIDGRCMFEPLVVETLGIFNMPARQLLTDLGRRISHISGDVGQAKMLINYCTLESNPY